MIRTILCACLSLGVFTGSSNMYVGLNRKDEQLAAYKDSVSVLKKELDGFKFDIDSVRNIAKIDTVAIWAHGYNQAKEDKACSYFYSDGILTVTMSAAGCKYWYVKEVSSLKSEKKTVSGGGMIKDASIHQK